MVRHKYSYGILIILGFVVISILYLVVMSGTANVHGTVKVDSKLVSWEQNSPGLEDTEMISVNGYCIKGPVGDNRLLLSTKNKQRTEHMKYSFTAKEGMRHVIVVYLQLDHLTGDIGQTLDLQFETGMIKKGELKRDIDITFEKIHGEDGISIHVTGTGYDKPKVFEYPLAEIPDMIKL